MVEAEVVVAGGQQRVALVDQVVALTMILVQPGGASTQTSPTGATGYGNAGSAAQGDTGGAGGGANAEASVGSGTTGGAGGAGKLFSNFVAWGTDSSNVASTGSNGGYFGGGGGGADTTGSGGAGGSGIILIRYAGSPAASGGTETESGGYTYHAYTSTGNATFTTD